jgi:hypothetical protein
MLNSKALVAPLLGMLVEKLLSSNPLILLSAVAPSLSVKL